MLFTSYSFLIFLLALFIFYYVIPKRYQWKLLLIASYVFYAFAGFKFLTYILITTVSTYLISLKIENLKVEQKKYLLVNKEELSREDKKAYKEKVKSIRWKWLVLCLTLNFGILAILKYTNFTIDNINTLFNWGNFGVTIPYVDFLLPLGISFYTFQTMGYIIDVYRGKYNAERNVFKLALFISFFPQLIQGPISRFDDLSQTMFKEHDFEIKNIELGLQRILWGYFKKLVIADRILIAVKTLANNPEIYNGSYVFVVMIFYAIQLYADFTGGIDITIGIGRVLGIRLKENFNRPYFSKSIAEYWRRWHISLGTWFKDYLFYPISVHKRMLELSRKSKKVLGNNIGRKLPIYIASISLWFITGVWHGASWNFIVWGLLNCFIIVLSQECEPLYKRFHAKYKIGQTGIYKIFMIVRTFLLMSSLRLLDCYRDIGTAFEMYGSMFTTNNLNIFVDGSLLNIGLTLSDYFIILFGVLAMIAVSLRGRDRIEKEYLRRRPMFLRYAVYYGLILIIIIFGTYGIGYDSSQFIYSQF